MKKFQRQVINAQKNFEKIYRAAGLVIILLFIFYGASKPKDEEEIAETEEEMINFAWENEVKEFTFASSAAATYSTPPTERPLILYSYHETMNARINALFFIRHGLHSSADFIFILNGDTNISDILPPNAQNIKVVKRENTCFDLGAFGEVLRANDEELLRKYKKFILMNASIRGPFLPIWSSDCWSDIFLRRLNDQVKLVGMTFNCIPARHVQSMILATDEVGIRLLMAEGTKETSLKGLSKCYEDKWEAIFSGELALSELINRASYKYEVLMTAASAIRDYYTNCAHTDVNWHDHYYGFSIHPYETIFIKANRNITPHLVSTLTQMHNDLGYSSWDICDKSS